MQKKRFRKDISERFNKKKECVLGKAEEEFKKSSKEWSATFDAMTDMISIHDKNFNIIKVNKAFADAFKGKPKDFIGKKCYEVVHHTKKPFDGCPLKKTLKSKKPVLVEIYEPRLKKYLEISTMPLFNGKKEVVSTIHSIRDITDRKKAEEELHRYESIVSSSADMIALLNKDHVYLAANDAYAEAFGLTKDKVVGKTATQIFGQKFFREVIEPKSKKCLTGKNINYTDWFDFPVTGKKYMDIHYSPFIGEDKKIEGFVVIGRDITEQKKYEEKLKESEAKFHALFEGSVDAIFIANKAGKLINCNNEAVKLTGYSQKEILSMNAMDLIPPERLKENKNAFKSHAKGESNVLETKILKKDKKTRVSVSINSSIINIGSQQFLQGVFRDISEQKKAEKKLKESEEKYHGLFSNMAMGFAYHKVIYNKKGNPIDYEYIEINDAFEEQTGLKRENVIGKRVTKIIPDIRKQDPDLVSIFGNVAKTGKPVTIEIYFPPLKRWYSINAYSSKKDYFAVVFLDATQRREGEKKLKESAEQMALLLQMNESLSKSLDLPKILQSLTDSASKIIKNGSSAVYLLDKDVLYLGATTPPLPSGFPENLRRAPLINHPHIRKTITKGSPLIVPDLRNEKLTAAEQEVSKKRNLRTVVYIPLIGSNGVVGVYIVGCTGVPCKISDSQKTILSAFSVSASIAIENARLYQFAQDELKERKKAEEILKESEEKYRHLVSNIPAVFWRSDTKGKTTFISQKVKEIYGYSPEEIYKGGAVLWFGRIHKDDIKRVKKKYGLFFEKKKQFDIEYRIKRKDGKWIWLHDGGIKVLEKGKASFSEGFFTDITGRKRAEQELKESEEKFRNLVERSNDGIVIAQDQKMKYLNPAIEKMVGYTKGELIGKDFKIVMHPTEIEKVIRRYNLRMAGKKVPSQYELILIDKKGKSIPTEINESIMTYKGRLADFVIIRNITERKKAEEELKNIFKLSPDMVGVFTSKGKLIKINSAWEKILGYKSEEILKIGWLNLIHPDDLEPTNKTVKEQLKGQSVANFINRYKCKDGSYKTLEWQATAAFDNIVYATARDVTEKKKAEEEIKKLNKELKQRAEFSEEKYKKLYDSSKDAIMILEPPKWKFTAGNSSAIGMFGAKDESEFTSKALWEFSPKYQPDKRLSSEKAKDMIGIAMKKGSNFFEWTHKRLRDGDFFATILLTRLNLNGKDVLQATVRDITQEKKSREDLERFNKIAIGRELKMVELKKKIKKLGR